MNTKVMHAFLMWPQPLFSFPLLLCRWLLPLLLLPSLLYSPLGYAETESSAPPPIRIKGPIPPPPFPVELEQHFTADLAYHLDEVELKWIGEEAQRFLTLFQEQQSGQPKGHVLLFPEWGNSANHPLPIRILRRQLPQIGWDTYALSPPAPRPLQTEAQRNQFKTLLQQRISLLLNEVAPSQGFRLYVAQGNMAAQLNQLLIEQAIPEPDALVLLSSYHPDAEQRRAISKGLATLALPILDISSPQDHNAAQHAFTQRKLAMQRQAKLNYRAAHLLSHTTNEQQSGALYKLIYGWLTSMGWY